MAGPKIDIEQVNDLSAQLAGKAATDHSHDETYLPVSAKGDDDGVAPLVGGTIPAQYLQSTESVGWGNIIGDIENQADLTALLDLKLDVTSDLDFGKIINLPSTLAGHGITDAYTKTESDSRYLQSGAYAASTLQVIAGDGVLGGGALDSDIELSLDSAWLQEYFLLRGDTAANSGQLGGVSSTKYMRNDTDVTKTDGDFTFSDRLELIFGGGADLSIRSDATNGIMVLGSTLYMKNSAEDTDLFSFDTSGNFVADGDITAFSDVRLKENIEKLPSALEKVLALEGCTWTRKGSGKRQTGLIAQDVMKVLPEAVNENENGYLSVAYGNLAGLFVEALKELHELVKDK